MATRRKVRRTVRKATVRRRAQSRKARAPVAKTPVQEALEVTWVLKGHLKNAQISYLRVGGMLSRVRDKKLYAALGHATLEDYAEQRLRLGRTSLYKYLQVYEWVSAFHPEWLQPKPKGFIPDLSDVADLIWIEKELKRKDLTSQARTELEALRAKALDGRLKKNDLDSWQRRGGRAADGLKSFLSRVRLLRKRGSALDDMPAEAISHFDAAIEIIRNAMVVRKAER